MARVASRLKSHAICEQNEEAVRSDVKPLQETDSVFPVEIYLGGCTGGIVIEPEQAGESARFAHDR